MRMCSLVLFLTEDPEGPPRLDLALWKAFPVTQPCLAPPQFRLHTWHSEREANPRGQPSSGRRRRERRRDNRRKGTKQAVGCDRKMNTYHVRNSPALFLFQPDRAVCRWTFSGRKEHVGCMTVMINSFSWSNVLLHTCVYSLK